MLDSSRRCLLEVTAIGALLASFAKFTSQPALAGSHDKRLRLDGPQAKALQHAHDATKPPNPLYIDEFIRGNCIQWKERDAARG